MAYKTPGVYIKEVPLFPPSVAQVETAIPAFVGFTEKAQDSGGKPLLNLPVRIKSLVEFQSLFGSGFIPVSYKVVADAAKENALLSVSPNKRFYLYDALRQFYDNGGGDCYIVSVGSYSDDISFAGLKTGLDLLRKYDEPTLLVIPDSVGLKDGDGDPDLVSFSELQKISLKQCADLQDRFSLFDILQGNLAEDSSNKPISDFRDKIGINFLSYGAVYYPWIVASYNYDVSFRQIELYDQSDLATRIVNFDPYARDDAEKGLISVLAAAQADADAATDTTMPFIDKAVLRSRGSEYLKELLAGFESKLSANSAVITNITNYLNLLAGIAGCFKKAETQSPDGSGFRKDIEALRADSELTSALEFLVSIEKNPKTIDNTQAARDAAALELLYKPLETAWFGNKTYAAIAADTTDFAKSNTGCLAIISALNDSVTKLLNGYQRLLDSGLFYEKQAEKAVFASHFFFHGVKDKILEHMRTLPPSGAVTGVYAMVDRTRGVWKAPANVSLNSVIGPAIKIDSNDQENLNVHPTGKSVNAIRAFTGKGTLVWGSRTLAGNDNEWRYVPVRRFFVMVEESTKKASEPFVFEPNDANTWVKVRAMIENFLILQWRAGALQGAKPEEAFFVKVGLNETMTELDVLEGRMIVEIGMAVVRPAEFIILRFSHKMLTSNS